MGCACKNSNSPKTYVSLNGQTVSNDDKSYSEFSNTKIIPQIIKYTFKFIGFLIGLIFLPFIMIAIAWFMFELIVLSKEVDMKKITNVLTSKLKPFNDNYYEELDDDDEYDEDEEDIEYVPINVEDITNYKN